MINRKKKQVYSEIEELLSDNKKATECFKRIQKKEEKTQKISDLIIFISLLESILSILVFGFCMNSNLLPEIVGIPLLIIMCILFLGILRLSDKKIFSEPSTSNELDFINGILKEEGKCEETKVIQSGEKQYVEVIIGSDVQLICINDGKSPEKIESCLVSYYKNIELSRYADSFFVKDMYRILVKYQEQTESKLLKENVPWG